MQAQKPLSMPAEAEYRKPKKNPAEMLLQMYPGLAGNRKQRRAAIAQLTAPQLRLYKLVKKHIKQKVPYVKSNGTQEPKEESKKVRTVPGKQERKES